VEGGIVTAYVLIQTEPVSEPLARRLRTIPGIVSAEDLSGPYDAIALARSDSADLPIEGMLAQIRDLPGVTRALPAHLLNGDSGSRGEAA
jgi:hypothetical protein